MDKELAGIGAEEREKVSRQWGHPKVPALVLGQAF